MNKEEIIKILKSNSQADIESERKAEILAEESKRIWEETKKAT